MDQSERWGCGEDGEWVRSGEDGEEERGGENGEEGRGDLRGHSTQTTASPGG